MTQQPPRFPFYMDAQTARCLLAESRARRAAHAARRALIEAMRQPGTSTRDALAISETIGQRVLNGGAK